MRSLVVAALAISACAAPSILTPATGPGTDYPCGVHGLVCRAHAGYCCNENEVCGGDDPSCPAGMCCFVGSSLDLQARKSHAQRKATP